MQIFEKFAAFFFLILLVAIIAFLTFVPVPEESRQVILIVIGGLMTAATQALPKLFGVEDNEKEKLRVKVADLEVKFDTLKTAYDEMMKMLINRHVVDGQGFASPKQIEDKSK